MRLFIAVELPENIKKEILNASAHLPQKGLKKVEKENLHITMHFLGEKSEGECREIKKYLDLVEFESFGCALTKIGAFPDIKNPRVIWAGTTEDKIKSLYLKIIKALNLKPEPKFTSHITLARIKFMPDLNLLRKIIEETAIRNESFSVNEFVLKRSELTKAGPLYENLHIIISKDRKSPDAQKRHLQ